MAKRPAQRTRRPNSFSQPEPLEPRTLMTGSASPWTFDAPEFTGPEMAASVSPVAIEAPTVTAPTAGTTLGDIASVTAPAAPLAEVGHHDHDHEHDPIRAADPSAAFLYLQHDTIPNFARNPSNVALRSGRWDNPAIWSAGRVPGAGDVVQIGAGAIVDYAIVSDAPLRALGINPGGTLRFARDVNTRLTVGTAIVFEGGRLEIGRIGGSVSASVTAEMVFANYSLDFVNDPKQYGNGLLVFGTISVSGAYKSRTWVELANEALAGKDYIDLAEPVVGWQPGETLVLPDSRQISSHMADVFDSGSTNILPPEWEEVQIRQIVGNRIHLTAPLRFHHLGARNAEGRLELLPHVAVLDRNVTFRSEAPQGTRGHVMIGGRAEAFIRSARFQALGRTTGVVPLDNTEVAEDGTVIHIGANQIGRYSVHLHHLVGPENPTNTGYQFQLIGNAIDDGLKWGLALHGTSYGLIRDNVAYNFDGAAYVTEDGTEIENYFYRNFAARIVGKGGEDKDMSDTARSGAGFWLRRAVNQFKGNVVADASFAGLVINGRQLPRSIPVPAFRGAIPGLPGQSVVETTNAENIMSDFEVYGRSRHGVWMVFPTGTSSVSSNLVLRRFVAWHIHYAAILGYHFTGVTIDRALLLGDRQGLGIVRWAAARHSAGMQFTSYEANNLVIQNSRVENFHVGIIAPESAGGAISNGIPANPTLITDSTLANFVNLRVRTAKYDNSEIPGKAVHVNNTRFREVNTYGMRYLPPEQLAIEMKYLPPDRFDGRDLMSSDVVIVRNFNRVAGNDFQVYYLEQHPNFVVPAAPDGVGSPTPWRTNRRLWEVFQIALAGAVAPTATSKPGIAGYIGPIAASAPASPAIMPVAKSRNILHAKDRTFVVGW